MAWYYAVFFIGAIPGLFLRGRTVAKFSEITMLLTGLILVVLFGAQFTASEILRDSMARDMTAAVVLAVAAAFGSVALTFAFVAGLLRTNSCRKGVLSHGPTRRKAAGMTIRMWGPLGFFTLGMLIGYMTGHDPSDACIKVVLFILIGAVGVQSGMEVRLLQRERESLTRRSLILFAGLPVAVIGGTLLLSALMTVFLPLTWLECMLVVAPMGWQTLGGPLVMELRSVRLGNLAFLVNMFRDIVSLMIIPVVCRGRYGILGVAPGGVSTMDILLPVVTASAGKEYLIHAMWVGACCSFWAPILIWLISEVLPWTN